MAGDEFFLEVRNDNKKILQKIYLGKLRYNNMFAIHNWRYNTCDDSMLNDYYKMEERKNNNEIKYVVWNDEIIENIKNLFYNNIPITELEEIAYNDMNKIIK